MKQNGAWGGPPEFIMAAKSLRRCIVRLTPNLGKLIPHQYYSDVYCPEFLEDNPPLVVEYSINHFQV